MELTPQQKQRIAEEVVGFKSWLEGKGKNERQEHLEHGHRIAKLITPEKLSSLTEDGVYELYDSLWASMMWTNKKWYVDNKILNNGLAKVRDSLKNLLYGQGSIEERFDQIYTDAIGLGGAGVSEILHYNFPNQYCLWNDKPKTVLPYLGIDQLPEGFYKYQLKDGHAYQKCIDVINLIRHELENHGIPHPDFIDADLFFWYLFNNIKTQAKSEKSKGKTTSASSNSLAPQLGGFDPNYIPPILSDLELIPLA